MNMKFLQKNWLLSLVIIVLILSSAYWFAQNKVGYTPPSTQSTDTQKVAATLDVNDGVKATHYDLTSGIGKPALEVTQTATDGKVVTKGEGVNAFVISINGREASSETKEYWELLINGKSSAVGAGSYIVKQDDKIEWKISKF